jgi:hypothetical protein
LAVTLLFVEKIRKELLVLFWIADCWFSSNILLTSRNPKKIVDSPAFLDHGSAEKCAHTTRDPNKEDD